VSNQNELIGLLWAWLCMAVGGGILFGGVWLLGVQPPRRLFGPQRFRAVPWRGVDVLAIIFFTYFFIPVVVQAIGKLKQSDIGWRPTLELPFQVATIFFLLSAGTGTRPYQLGLTTHRLPANLVLGYVAWMILTPLVYAVLFLMTAVDSWLLPTPAEKHPLIEAFETNPGFLGYLMVFSAAVVAAPLLEELVFRGVLQPWLARRPWGADAALVGAFALALLIGLGSKTDKIFPLAGNPDHWRALMRSLAPGIFVLATIPGYLYADRLFWSWLPYPGAGRTVYAVALLFAAGHSDVWPSPVPLLFLGLGLGYLAYRTQSLVSCITVHVLFNGMAVLGLLWT
jgi:membrane protease YdiL (CAAX protease family)